MAAIKIALKNAAGEELAPRTDYSIITNTPDHYADLHVSGTCTSGSEQAEEKVTATISSSDVHQGLKTTLYLKGNASQWTKSDYQHNGSTPIVKNFNISVGGQSVFTFRMNISTMGGTTGDTTLEGWMVMTRLHGAIKCDYKKANGDWTSVSVPVNNLQNGYTISFSLYPDRETMGSGESMTQDFDYYLN